MGGLKKFLKFYNMFGFNSHSFVLFWDYDKDSLTLYLLVNT